MFSNTGGDPCPGVEKYTEIVYECIPPCPVQNVCRCEPGLTRYTGQFSDNPLYQLWKIILDPKTGHSWCLEECPAPECGENEQWNECGSECGETKCCQGDHCDTDHQGCTTVCQPRCECAEGTGSFLTVKSYFSKVGYFWRNIFLLNRNKDTSEMKIISVWCQNHASVSLYAFIYGNITLKQH